MNNAFSQKLDPKIYLKAIIFMLLVIIGGMLIVWKPWSAPTGNRTVEVVGEATVTAKPDEYVFYPSYQFKNADKAAALAELTQKSNEVVAKLKALGVPESKIKTNSSGYGSSNYVSPTSEGSDELTYALQLTVTVDNQDDAQKVQDYLVTTAPSGAVSPQAGFSDKKRKGLESEAREDATKDARKKAGQMASSLGFYVGKVKSINDDSGFSTMPYAVSDRASSGAESATSTSLAIQPGENELNYSITVVYFIK